jgi:hypothetical protein
MTKVVSIKMNPALLLRIDGLASNRSDFIRAAVEEKVKRAGVRGKSTWDTLVKTQGLDITIPKAAGQVKRTDVSQPFLFLDDRPDFWAQSSTGAPLLSRQ